jgi:hypothetical protein
MYFNPAINQVRYVSRGSKVNPTIPDKRKPVEIFHVVYSCCKKVYTLLYHKKTKMASFSRMFVYIFYFSYKTIAKSRK